MAEKESLTGKEKTLIALAAAIGGGCRTCAETLYAMAQTVEASSDEIERAFADGLRQRDNATEVMRQKAAALLGRTPRIEIADSGAPVSELAKLAASVALNSAPDALRHRQTAKAKGCERGGSRRGDRAGPYHPLQGARLLGRRSRGRPRGGRRLRAGGCRRLRLRRGRRRGGSRLLRLSPSRCVELGGSRSSRESALFSLRILG